MGNRRRDAVRGGAAVHQRRARSAGACRPATGRRCPHARRFARGAPSGGSRCRSRLARPPGVRGGHVGAGGERVRCDRHPDLQSQGRQRAELRPVHQFRTERRAPGRRRAGAACPGAAHRAAGARAPRPRRSRRDRRRAIVGACRLVPAARHHPDGRRRHVRGGDRTRRRRQDHVARSDRRPDPLPAPAGSASAAATRRCCPPSTATSASSTRRACLFPHLSVAGNIGYAGGRSSAAAEAIERLDLGALRRPPGGHAERRRTPAGRAGTRIGPAARAFCCSTSRSARSTRAAAPSARQTVRELHHDWQLTTVHVTHDFAEAGFLGQLAVLLDGGRLVQSGEPAEHLPTSGDAFRGRISRRRKRLRRPRRGRARRRGGALRRTAVPRRGIAGTAGRCTWCCAARKSCSRAMLRVRVPPATASVARSPQSCRSAGWPGCMSMSTARC